MNVQPYVFFDGRCDEAIEFYKKAFGLKVNMLMRYKDCPDPNAKMDPASLNKVMHADVSIGAATVLMSDGHCQGNPKFEGFSLALQVADDAEAKKCFAALAEGGKITMPLGKTFFSSSFGMLSDRFGVAWMVLVQH